MTIIDLLLFFFFLNYCFYHEVKRKTHFSVAYSSLQIRRVINYKFCIDMIFVKTRRIIFWRNQCD